MRCQNNKEYNEFWGIIYWTTEIVFPIFVCASQKYHSVTHINLISFDHF